MSNLSIKELFSKDHPNERIVEVDESQMQNIISDIEIITSNWISYAVDSDLSATHQRPFIPLCTICFNGKTIHFKQRKL